MTKKWFYIVHRLEEKYDLFEIGKAMDTGTYTSTITCTPVFMFKTKEEAEKHLRLNPSKRMINKTEVSVVEHFITKEMVDTDKNQAIGTEILEFSSFEKKKIIQERTTPYLS